MHIGLIGGIGPSATVAYYETLIRGFQNAGLPLELTIAHADVATLIHNSGSDEREAQALVFAKHLQQLNGAGCDIATITALTGHFCFEETKALSPLPLVSAIEPIDLFCKTQEIDVVGLLGSPAVMSSHLFGQLHHPRTVIPESDSESLGRDYLELASSGVCSDITRNRFFTAGSEMVHKQNADAILLAGTDLGLAFSERDPGYRVIDALTIHVDALIALAHG